MNDDEIVKKGKELLIQIFLKSSFQNYNWVIEERFIPRYVTFDDTANPLFVFDESPVYDENEWVNSPEFESVFGNYEELTNVPVDLLVKIQDLVPARLRPEMIVELEDWMIATKIL